MDSPTPAELDKAHHWHPFTPMADWCADDHEPLFIESGQGAVLRDSKGNEYLDGNSTIWTNIHGHRHPQIDAAIRDQLEKIAHVSALGFGNEMAARLAAALVSKFPADTLTRVFFSDDGSTAIECACKMAIQFRQLIGQSERCKFVAFDGAYHGDTAGAASLGGIGAFHERFRRTGFETLHVADLAGLKALSEEEVSTLTAVAIEPLIQGAAGMRLWPKGMLREIREWCDANDVLLILDEVMTGFGRTGKLFACEHESVVPDFMCLAKGLTGGYLPLAATLTTERVFEAFLGSAGTFYYGHSYSANPLGCAAALASLEIFENEGVLESLPLKVGALAQSLERHFGENPLVSDVRQVGLIAGIDLKNPTDRRLGAEVCLAARKYGLLTRPVLDTLVLMPPLCASAEQIETAVAALSKATEEVCRF